jgi:hypothetical protein
MSQLDGYIQKYASKFGVRPDILARMVFQESSNNPRAVGPETSQGTAKGASQALDSTARDPGYGVAPLKNQFDLEDSVRFGAEYLAMNLEKFGGDYELALAGYHSGPSRVEKLLAQGKNILDMSEQFPNTVKHVDKVLGKRNEKGIRPFLAVAEPEVTLEAFVPTANDEAESDLANIAFENMTDEDIVMAQAVKPSGITSGAASGVDPQMQAIAAAVMEAKKGDPKAKGFRAMQMGLGMLDKDIQPMLEQLSSLQVPQRPPSAMDRFTGGIASLKDSIGNMFRMGN